jgi:hypothetical protein
MLYWPRNKNFKNYAFVSWFKILSQHDASIVFLLGFGMAMQYPYKFQKICYKTQMIFGIHVHYPLGSLDQNNLTHVGRAMHYPS